MSINILVFVELHDADANQCNEFDAAMSDRQWHKLPRKETVFQSTFDGSISDAALIRIVQRDVNLAVKAADILLWDGVCVFSDPPLTDPINLNTMDA